ncbi:hypothetical protein [Maribacter polysaccharolyticus]|uniref:hypothetical protein n=1 Tax=Maribacter polysaccharolyticus TaxID=3020831 RepID=UPI00237F3B3C|nr:hypothetical protein [Maribacter polysaccharolyticus]MDE3740314.1 hypothetical protein [Maribacter polysaccharolyticus]
MKLQKIKEIENVYSIVKIDNSSLLVSYKKEKARIYNSNNLDSIKKINQKLNVLEIFKNNDTVYFIDGWGKLFIKKMNILFLF